MTVIQGQDLIKSVADALQLISYAHPADFVRHMHAAWKREKNPAAKSAITQILVNSRMAMLGKRPICQDTGVVNVFLKIGMSVQWDSDLSIDEMVNEAVKRAYLHDENPLRASMVADPLGARSNTQDNTPAVIHTELVVGDKVEIHVAAKGGGSENKTRFAVLLPRDNVADWVVDQVSTMGAGWCPPGVLGIGVGGSVERAMLLAKQALLDPLDMSNLKERGAENKIDALRLEICDRVNALGIGAQGLGGITTVLDVKIKTHPTHAASMPVALIPNCAATRHIHFVLDGSGPAEFEMPDVTDWPEIVSDYVNDKARKVDLDSLTKDDVRNWTSGETLLLSGKLLTGRDAAHHRLAKLIDDDLPLPVDLKGRVIYYVGPVEAVSGEVVGPAGPTTATRMDPFVDQLLESTGLLGMIGKAERGPEAIEAIKRHGVASLVAVGGAAFLISQSIKSSKVIAFPELGMEAIHEFEVVDLPVTVAVDSKGRSIHTFGPEKWRTSFEVREK